MHRSRMDVSTKVEPSANAPPAEGKTENNCSGWFGESLLNSMHWRARQTFDNRQGIYRAPTAPNGFATGRRTWRRAPDVHPQIGSTFCLVAPYSDAHKVSVDCLPPHGWANGGTHDLSLFK
eukprot:4223140-Pyramimonas_sp.AAC.1